MSALSFEQAKMNISSRYDYLELISFNGSREMALFLDKEYGEFRGVYYRVYNGSKMHKLRANARTKDARNRKSTKSKIIETNIKKYGVENVFQSESIKSKIKENNLKKYGIEYTTKLNSVKDKIKETLLDRYGIEHALQSNVFLDKLKETNLKKYGYEYAMHNDLLKEKQRKSIVDSGYAYNIDGYSASEYYRSNNVKGSLTSFHCNIKSVGIENAILFDPYKTNIENIISQHLIKSNIDFIFNKKIDEISERPDFLIKDNSLIIECDGLYYHSDGYGSSEKIRNNKHFHKERQEKYKELGYRSLFFREDEILNKTKIVESIILAKLELITNKVFARKTKIIELPSKKASAFFEENHLMGRGSGQCYALTYEDKIVSAIRIIKKKDYIDISRFCSALHTNVVGGLGKLLKHVIKEHNPQKIISFVDMRYGDGHSLEKLGFVEKTNHVSFKWTDFKQTFHRLNFKGNSGYENGLFKIWDCGQKKFKYE